MMPNLEMCFAVFRKTGLATIRVNIGQRSGKARGTLACRPVFDYPERADAHSRVPQFRGDDGEERCRGAVLFKHDVTNPGLPNS